MDTLHEIVAVVRDAVAAGLIPSETVEHYDDAVKHLSGSALEEYIQNLWDHL